MLLDALRGTHTLLVLDNLESLLKWERDIVFTFVKRLPPGCKAILTSRGRIGSAAEELILEQLSEIAALATLERLAERNPALARTSQVERRDLYRETNGNPLLLRWTAGQIGRGSCLTLSDAIVYLRSCPRGNDPLEFIFGDLVEDFSEVETHVLCALTYFGLPAKVEHIADTANHSVAESDQALRSLVNRSLVVPTEELKTFTLIPLVADFLRKKKPDAVMETGNQLEKSAYTVVVENGYANHDRFSVLDLAWPAVAAALPRFLAGPNDQLQRVCDALTHFLNFTGRYDESLALNNDAETRAVLAHDFLEAGWRAHQVGWIHFLRGQSVAVQSCADRVEAYWNKANVSTREKAIAKGFRGISYRLTQNHAAAIALCREAVELSRTLGSQTKTLVDSLNELATAERYSGDFNAAERDYGEALRTAKAIGYAEAVAYITGNLAAVELERGNWVHAEALEREALSLSENVSRPQFLALDCQGLALALLRQGKKVEALPYARRAVEIFARLGLPDLGAAEETLAECEK
jgi:tetratricopeptide (TPR) repeat protein